MVVGSPTDSGTLITSREEGSVQIFEQSSGYPLLAELNGPENHSRFGYDVRLVEETGQLLVGAPRYHATEKVFINMHVLLFNRALS